MSIGYPVRPEFVPCPSCAAKHGAPDLCRECVERRSLYGVVLRVREMMPQVGTPLTSWGARDVINELRQCQRCLVSPLECREHGR